MKKNEFTLEFWIYLEDEIGNKNSVLAQIGGL